MNPYAVKLAFRHLLSQPGQTALLMAGVALGVSVFIFMSALIGGLATLLTLRFLILQRSATLQRLKSPSNTRLACAMSSSTVCKF